MTVTWEVEDGYCGKSRPQYTDVPDEELAHCETEDERQALIEEYIQSDFEQRISWCIVGSYEYDPST